MTNEYIMKVRTQMHMVKMMIGVHMVKVIMYVFMKVVHGESEGRGAHCEGGEWAIVKEVIVE